MNNTDTKGGSGRKKQSFAPGIIVLSAAATIVFVLMLLAMYRSGMLPVPQFLLDLGFYGGDTDSGGVFMSDFLAAVESKEPAAQATTYERAAITDEDAAGILAAADSFDGRRTYDIVIASGAYQSERTVTITFDDGGWDVETVQRLISYSARSGQDGTVAAASTVAEGSFEYTALATYSGASDFSAQNEAGIISVADVLAARENGDIVNYSVSIVRSDRASDRNLLVLSFDYADSGIDEYCEFDIETGELLTEIASINGVPYFQATLRKT